MATEIAPRMNRTGASVAPIEAQKTVEGARRSKPSTPGDSQDIAALRTLYIAEGVPIGSRPPTESVPAIFMDKLGDRLAFERGGTRLYEAMLAKVRAASGSTGGPTEHEIQHIMEEEAQHFAMVHRVIEGLGGDPTMETPSADISGVASVGIVQILTDARTTVPQCVEALLIAELADNDAWQMLIEMAQSLGQAELATEFQSALEEEREHLEMVRGWTKSLALTELGAKP
jgi:rubrerythrin